MRSEGKNPIWGGLGQGRGGGWGAQKPLKSPKMPPNGMPRAEGGAKVHLFFCTGHNDLSLLVASNTPCESGGIMQGRAGRQHMGLTSCLLDDIN